MSDKNNNNEIVNNGNENAAADNHAPDSSFAATGSDDIQVKSGEPQTDGDGIQAENADTQTENANIQAADISESASGDRNMPDGSVLKGYTNSGASENSSKPKSGKLRFLNMRKFKYGVYAAIITVIVLAALVLVNVAISALESNFGLRADLTSMGRFTLSEQTVEVLKTIEKDVEIIVMTQTPNNIDENIKELVSRYTSRNSHISFRTENPISNPGFARQFTDDATSTMSSGSVVVTNKEYTKYKVMSQYDFYSFNSEGYAQYFTGENVLTSAILYVDSEVTPKVYFLTGHEETPLSSVSFLETYLERENYDVSEINLILQNIELEPLDTLVVLSPKKDISDDEWEKLREFVLGGGKMLYMYDVGVDSLPNFESILKLYNVGFEAGAVVEDPNATGKWYQTPVCIAPTLESHAITDNMIANNMFMLIPAGRAVSLPDSPKSGVTVTSLIKSSDASFNMQDLNNTTLTKADSDPTGPFSLAVAVEQTNYEDETLSTRLVVVGNSMFVSQTYYLQISSNLDFFLSAIKWMSPQKVNISIYAKSLLSQSLNIQNASEAMVLMGIVLLALPLLVLIGGGVVWMRRRHL